MNTPVTAKEMNPAIGIRNKVRNVFQSMKSENIKNKIEINFIQVPAVFIESMDFCEKRVFVWSSVSIIFFCKSN